jgi:hypothetical protein
MILQRLISRLTHKKVGKEGCGQQGVEESSVQGFSSASVIFVSPASRNSHEGIGSRAPNSVTSSLHFRKIGSSWLRKAFKSA